MIMSGYSAYMEDDDQSLRGFKISFTWDYPDDWCLKNVQDEVFHLIDSTDVQRSESQAVCDCIQSSQSGVIFSQPIPERHSSVPCELHIQQQSFVAQVTVSKLIVVSEAKHIELYVNDIYEKTSKGFVLTIKKGSTPSLYQGEFDLSGHVHTTDKIVVKFASLATPDSMRLQTVVVIVTKCSPAAIQTSLQRVGGSVDINGIRSMLQEMGLSVPKNAESLMKDIEHKQYQDTHGGSPKTQSLLKMYSSVQQQMQHGERQPQVPRHSFQGFVKQSKLSSSNRSLQSLYPLSRENVQPAQSSRGSMRKSRTANDVGYNGFGTPNPPQESALANALLNMESAKVTATSRASHIEKDNYENMQMQLVKQLLATQNTKAQHVVRRPQHNSAKDRPKSFTALPSSASEADFTRMLVGLMQENEPQEEAPTKRRSAEELSAGRWEAYLRSRVRTSQKMSGSRGSSVHLEESSENPQDLNGSTHNTEFKCLNCGNNMQALLDDTILLSEERIKRHLDNRINEMRVTLDSRLDAIYNAIASPQQPRYDNHDDDGVLKSAV